MLKKLNDLLGISNLEKPSDLDLKYPYYNAYRYDLENVTSVTIEYPFWTHNTNSDIENEIIKVLKKFNKNQLKSLTITNKIITESDNFIQEINKILDNHSDSLTNVNIQIINFGCTTNHPDMTKSNIELKLNNLTNIEKLHLFHPCDFENIQSNKIKELIIDCSSDNGISRYRTPLMMFNFNYFSKTIQKLTIKINNHEDFYFHRMIIDNLSDCEFPELTTLSLENVTDENTLIIPKNMPKLQNLNITFRDAENKILNFILDSNLYPNLESCIIQDDKHYLSIGNNTYLTITLKNNFDKIKIFKTTAKSINFVPSNVKTLKITTSQFILHKCCQLDIHKLVLINDTDKQTIDLPNNAKKVKVIGFKDFNVFRNSDSVIDLTTKCCLVNNLDTFKNIKNLKILWCEFPKNIKASKITLFFHELYKKTLFVCKMAMLLHPGMPEYDDNLGLYNVIKNLKLNGLEYRGHNSELVGNIKSLNIKNVIVCGKNSVSDERAIILIGSGIITFLISLPILLFFKKNKN